MEDNSGSEKTISNQWLENIFSSLMKLETYERLLKEGCSGILEYITNPNINLADIQYKNYKLFLTEMEIIIENTKHLIEKEKYLQISILFNSIKKFEKEVGSFLYTQYDMVGHNEWSELKPEFERVKPKISRLRSLLVSALWKILSPSAKENLGDVFQ